MSEVSLQALQQAIAYERKITDERIDSLYRELDKARVALDIRLGHMNEFRAQIQEERTVYVRKDWLDGQLRFIWSLILVVAGAVSFVVNLWLK